jgi:hypothetical protein
MEIIDLIADEEKVAAQLILEPEPAVQPDDLPVLGRPGASTTGRSVEN